MRPISGAEPRLAASPHPDLVIAELAEQRHGVMSRAQLLAAGVSDDAIRHRLAVRRLARRFPGVYEIEGNRNGQSALFIAAVLACGEGAVLSHRSAAALWNLRTQTSGRVEVTVPREGGRRRRAIRVHVTRRLPPHETAVVDGIPCTSPARTIVDCANVLPRYHVKRMLERAEIERIFDLPAFEAAAARAGHRGARVVRELLAEMTAIVPPTRSELEARFLALIEDAALPRPVVNGTVGGLEVDFHWPRARLIVETDGGATHGTRTAFHRDRDRDFTLELAGWHVIRITWRQLRDEPGRVVALLRRHLDRL